ncbi:TetR/AcrR family transcriptional regulator [Neobacillus mesonae]|nr:TetR/AcrR family transcriptional regulator [Neobacillus mesonae]
MRIEVKRRKDVAQIKKDIAHQSKELFAQKGYHATSMEDICHATGRSKGSIYYHFKSKEELFIHLIKLNNEEWVEAWHKKEEQYDTVIQKLYALADHYVDDMDTPLTNASNEFASSQGLGDDLMEEILSILRLPYVMYEELIIEGMERGELRKDNPNDVMYIVQGLMAGLSTLFFEKDMIELRRLYKKGIDTLLVGIKA